jgi:predicted dehydrogenase
LASAGAAIAVPTLVPGSVLGLNGAVAPSNRILVGALGLGFGWNTALGNKETKLMAICDVHAGKLRMCKREADKANGDDDCKMYGDFREVIARDDIDAVYIATPDHWHALVAIAAARAGKDIYCQKPVTHTVAEGQALVDAVRRHGVVFQHGTQQRSEWTFWFAAELVRNGRIGELKRVRLGVPSGRSCPTQPPEPVPPDLNWDMWLGPAPWAPFATERCLSMHSWYFISDYCVGYIAGWGIHHLDSGLQGAGDDLGDLVEIESTARFPTDGIYDTPITWRVEYTLPSGVKIIDADVSQEEMGVLYEGTEGTVFCWRGNRLETNPKSLRDEIIGPNEWHSYESHDESFPKVTVFDSTPTHFQNWVDCIRSRKPTAASIDIAHRSVTLCNIGAISMLLGRKLQWDPRKEQFINDDEANRLLATPMREPWTMA